MLEKLTFQQKKYLMVATGLIVLYIGYAFSFKNTISAISLNAEMISEQAEDHSLELSYPQLDRQNAFYINAVKSFHVKKDDRENRLWQAVSGIAISKNVALSFVPTVQLVDDSVANKKGMVIQQFQFKGNYFDVVRLLDSISRTPDIGRITEMKMATNKDENTSEKPGLLKLQLTLGALAN